MVNRKPFEHGYSLIELMIVIAIISVLAAIAYPSYQQYVIKTHRANMMAEIHNIAARIHTRKLVEGGYNLINLSTVLGAPIDNGSVPFPQNQTNYDYDVMIIDTATNSIMRCDSSTPPKCNMTTARWQIQAIPVRGNMMGNDGTLTLDPDGKKCRILTNTDGSKTSKCGANEEWKN